MGCDFRYEICANSCEDKCEVDYKSKYGQCKCEKIENEKFYLRNNSYVWEMLKVSESPIHFSYKEIEDIVNHELEKVDKIEILMKTTDEFYDNNHDWQLLMTLADILRTMTENNSTCVWMCNS